MKGARTASGLRAPFLKSIALDPSRVADPSRYPFSIPAIAAEPFRIDFTRPVTLLAGVNATGKSTIVEAIAFLCGFGRLGGNRNYAVGDQGQDLLGNALKAAWLPKIGRGFYTRAETFSDFIGQIDEIAREDGPAIYADYGGRSLSQRSHGEAYLQVFRNRVSGRGIYLFDEPEAALSPARQIEFIQVMKQAEQTGDAQFIIATHSPLLMAYPGATLLHLTDHGLVERPFQMTEHYRVLREFYLDPTGFMDAILTG